MAIFFNDTVEYFFEGTINSVPPQINSTITYEITSRKTNQVTVKFTIKTWVGSGSWHDYQIDCNIGGTVIRIRDNRTDEIYGWSVTKTQSITFSASASDTSKKISFNFIGRDLNQSSRTGTIKFKAGYTLSGNPSWIEASPAFPDTFYDTVNLKWGPGTNGTNNIVTGYEISFYKEDKTKILSKSISGKNTLSTTISNIDAYSSIKSKDSCYFTIKSISQYGSKGEATKSNIITKNSPPEITFNDLGDQPGYQISYSNNKIILKIFKTFFSVTDSDSDDKTTVSVYIGNIKLEEQSGYYTAEVTTLLSKDIPLKINASDGHYSVSKTSPQNISIKLPVKLIENRVSTETVDGLEYISVHMNVTSNGINFVDSVFSEGRIKIGDSVEEDITIENGVFLLKKKIFYEKNLIPVPDNITIYFKSSYYKGEIIVTDKSIKNKIKLISINDNSSSDSYGLIIEKIDGYNNLYTRRNKKEMDNVNVNLEKSIDFYISLNLSNSKSGVLDFLKRYRYRYSLKLQNPSVTYYLSADKEISPIQENNNIKIKDSVVLGNNLSGDDFDAFVSLQLYINSTWINLLDNKILRITNNKNDYKISILSIANFFEAENNGFDIKISKNIEDDEYFILDNDLQENITIQPLGQNNILQYVIREVKINSNKFILNNLINLPMSNIGAKSYPIQYTAGELTNLNIPITKKFNNEVIEVKNYEIKRTGFEDVITFMVKQQLYQIDNDQNTILSNTMVEYPISILYNTYAHPNYANDAQISLNQSNSNIYLLTDNINRNINVQIPNATLPYEGVIKKKYRWKIYQLMFGSNIFSKGDLIESGAWYNIENETSIIQIPNLTYDRVLELEVQSYDFTNIYKGSVLNSKIIKSNLAFCYVLSDINLVASNFNQTGDGKITFSFFVTSSGLFNNSQIEITNGYSKEAIKKLGKDFRIKFSIPTDGITINSINDSDNFEINLSNMDIYYNKEYLVQLSSSLTNTNITIDFATNLIEKNSETDNIIKTKIFTYTILAPANIFSIRKNGIEIFRPDNDDLKYSLKIDARNADSKGNIALIDERLSSSETDPYINNPSISFLRTIINEDNEIKYEVKGIIELINDSVYINDTSIKMMSNSLKDINFSMKNSEAYDLASLIEKYQFNILLPNDLKVGNNLIIGNKKIYYDSSVEELIIENVQ